MRTPLRDWQLEGRDVTVQRCPTCGGNGILPHGFYWVPLGQPFEGVSTALETCRTCKGSGLVDVLVTQAGASVEPVAKGEA